MDTTPAPSPTSSDFPGTQLCLEIGGYTGGPLNGVSSGACVGSGIRYTYNPTAADAMAAPVRTPYDPEPCTSPGFLGTVCPACVGCTCVAMCLGRDLTRTGPISFTVTTQDGPVAPLPTDSQVSLANTTTSPTGSISLSKSPTASMSKNMPTFTGLAGAAYAPNRQLMAGLAVAVTWVTFMLGAGAVAAI